MLNRPFFQPLRTPLLCFSPCHLSGLSLGLLQYGNNIPVIGRLVASYEMHFTSTKLEGKAHQSPGPSGYSLTNEAQDAFGLLRQNSIFVQLFVHHDPQVFFCKANSIFPHAGSLELR